MTQRGGPERVRVLWVIKGLGPGGAERLLLSFGAAADHHRFSFTAAYVLPGKDHLVEPLRLVGVDSLCIGSDRRGVAGWLGPLRDLVRTQRVEIVHFHSPLLAGLGRPAVAALPSRPAIVTTQHNVWSSFHPFTRAIDRSTSALDDHSFSVSDAVRRGLPARVRSRSEVLVHGVDLQRISSRRRERELVRRELGVEGRRVVVTVANLRADKDYPNLFAAAERVLAELDDVVFLAVGQGQLEEQLRDDLGRRGFGDRFRMVGHQEDPIAYLVAADVFTLASRHEGLPISLLEALAAGLPAAVTSVGGVPDVITDGVEGRLVPPQDPAALAAAIGELLDPEMNERMSAAASARARDFGIARAVERQQAVYAQLAARRR